MVYRKQIRDIISQGGSQHKVMDVLKRCTNKKRSKCLEEYDFHHKKNPYKYKPYFNSFDQTKSANQKAFFEKVRKIHGNEDLVEIIIKVSFILKIYQLTFVI